MEPCLWPAGPVACGCLSSSCLSSSGCLGLSGLNLTKGKASEACEGGGEEVL